MCSQSRCLNAGRFPTGRVTPTAAPWPPKRVSKSLADSIASKRLTFPTERPLPRAWPSSMVNRSTGTPYSPTKRDATMPFTPSCHPSPATTSTRSPAYSRCAWASATSESSASIWRRRVFTASSFCASRLASSKLSDMSKSSASAASSMRPAALSRGTSEKLRFVEVSALPSMPETAASAAMHGRGASFIWRSPSDTRARFSSRIGMRSATVPNVAKSV